MRVVSCLLVAVLWSSAPSARSQDPAPIQEVLRQHRGKVVVLNFWATWCAPCKKELPLLSRLQGEYESRAVQFLGASTDAPGEREEASALLAEARVEYPNVFGLSDVDMNHLGLGSLLPATAVFDRDGKLVFRLIGEVKKKRLVERLEWLLGPRAGSPPGDLLLPGGVNAGDYEE